MSASLFVTVGGVLSHEVTIKATYSTLAGVAFRYDSWSVPVTACNNAFCSGSFTLDYHESDFLTDQCMYRGTDGTSHNPDATLIV